MVSKVFSIRDAETLGDAEIKVIATRVAPTSPAEAQALEGTPGAALPGVIRLARADGAEATYSPYDWQTGGRAMRVAHTYIAERWFDLGSGSVIDAASILAPAGQSGATRSGRG
jgi:hypothetical protein